MMLTSRKPTCRHPLCQVWHSEMCTSTLTGCEVLYMHVHMSCRAKKKKKATKLSSSYTPFFRLLHCAHYHRRMLFGRDMLNFKASNLHNTALVGVWKLNKLLSVVCTVPLHVFFLYLDTNQALSKLWLNSLLVQNAHWLWIHIPAERGRSDLEYSQDTSPAHGFSL